MKNLSQTNFDKAEQFLLTTARPLEKQLYYYHFKPISSSYQAVIDELAKFQNSDGGFGQALEPDIRMEESSVVATKFALQILLDINAPSSEKLVQNSLRYLLNHYEKETKRWVLVDENVRKAPHAPWWTFENLEKNFSFYLANPRAGILRILLHYDDLVPKQIISEVSSSLFSYLEKLPTDIGFFDAVGFLQLLQSEKLIETDREKIFSKLQPIVLALVSTNPDKWVEFSNKPLWFAPSPLAPFYELLKVDIVSNLNFEIENQCKDGSWLPTWQWKDKWLDHWEHSKTEWKGILTLAMLRTLRDFDLIDGLSTGTPASNFKYHID